MSLPSGEEYELPSYLGITDGRVWFSHLTRVLGLSAKDLGNGGEPERELPPPDVGSQFAPGPVASSHCNGYYT